MKETTKKNLKKAGMITLGAASIGLSLNPITGPAIHVGRAILGGAAMAGAIKHDEKKANKK